MFFHDPSRFYYVAAASVSKVGAHRSDAGQTAVPDKWLDTVVDGIAQGRINADLLNYQGFFDVLGVGSKPVDVLPSRATLMRRYVPELR